MFANRYEWSKITVEAKSAIALALILTEFAEAVS